MKSESCTNGMNAEVVRRAAALLTLKKTPGEMPRRFNKRSECGEQLFLGMNELSEKFIVRSRNSVLFSFSGDGTIHVFNLGDSVILNQVLIHGSEGKAVDRRPAVILDGFDHLGLVQMDAFFFRDGDIFLHDFQNDGIEYPETPQFHVIAFQQGG